MNHHGHVDKASTGYVRKLEELLSTSDNSVCADCGAVNPTWASTNIGAFICVKCCDIHKSLGAHISKVLSITSNEWSDDDVESMIEIGGNSCVNAIYEEFIPNGVLKPNPTANSEERAKFIRSKYDFQEFLKLSLRIVPSIGPYTSIESHEDTSIESHEDTDNANTTNNSKKVEFIGELKVKVIKGTNLAVRDVLTSDPYVVLTFGQQRIQTSIKQSNLNPIGNEEFRLSVPPQYGTLKLQVFDHDKLFVNDTMGEAEIDLQPTVTAAMTFEDAGLLEDMQIGKWLKSSDNALINDSTINILGGKIKQDVFIKLQNVESGEIQIEIEWIPLLHTY